MGLFLCANVCELIPECDALHAGDEYFGRYRCEPRRWLLNVTSIASEYEADSLYAAVIFLCVAAAALYIAAVSLVSVSASAAVDSLSDGAVCDI